MITLDVIGKPAPKGSKRAFVNKHTGRANVVDDNPKSLIHWEQAVARAVEAHLEHNPDAKLSGPVDIRLSFRFPTVASDPHRYWHAVKPDIDKLARAVLDVLSNMVMGDDCTVAKMSTSKRYIIVTNDENPGCTIEIDELAGEEFQIQQTRKERARAARRAPVLQTEALPL